jgi:hypothetical protein
MCQNYPNCNCPSCTQCQDCTQVTPTCVTTITTSCTTEQFTEECPNGLQSTDCLVYTGDTLKDCENNDFLFRGTKFNTFLSQLWETVKCAATATTDTIDYTGANILDCDGNILVPTDTPVTEALNLIWEEVKCPVIPKATDLIIEDLDLTDCDNNLVFRGNTTVFDTINIIWEYVKCLGNTSTSDDIIFTEELKTCENVTLVSGNGNLTDAITSIWNNIKCWYTDLQDTINDLTDNVNEALDNKQPIWKFSNDINIDSQQNAPFNNLEPAIQELSKYHFDGKKVTLFLENGTYSVSGRGWYNPLLNSCSELVIRNKSGQNNVIIQSGSVTAFIGHEGPGKITFEGVNFKQNSTGGVVYVNNNATVTLKNIPYIENSASSNSPIIQAMNNSSIVLENSILTDLRNLGLPVAFVFASYNSDITLGLSILTNLNASSSIEGVVSLLNSKITHRLYPGLMANKLNNVYYAGKNSSIFVENTVTSSSFTNIEGALLYAKESSYINFGANSPFVTVSTTDSYGLIVSEDNSSIEFGSISCNNFRKPINCLFGSKVTGDNINATNIQEPVTISHNSYLYLNTSSLSFKNTVQTLPGIVAYNNSFASLTSIPVATSNTVKYLANAQSKIKLSTGAFVSLGAGWAATFNGGIVYGT